MEVFLFFFFQGTGSQHISARDTSTDGGQPEAGGDLHLPSGGIQRAGTWGELAARQGRHAAGA